ncbi:MULTISPECIES: PxKF domain-containing protein [unclassified Kribbella]|uniref:PxKF domain-containing protein n=1 Tax=unclassified Kribbella TaxID=2644121 RepID=UPI00301A7B28
MTKHGTMARRAATGAAIAAAAALTVSGIAHADNINDTVEGTASVSLVAGDPASTGSADVRVVANSGDSEPGCNIDPGEQFVITFITPAGVTASPAALSFTGCGVAQTVSFTAAAGAVDGTVTATISTNTTGSGTFNNNVRIPIDVTTPVVVDPDGDNDGVPDASDNCPAAANADQANADGDALGNACDPNSYAPAAAAAPADGNGDEGSALTTAGAFTDADGNQTLTISKVSGAGTVTDHGDGTWSWSHSTTDDATGSVVVQASDGEHAAATETFDWTASNVAPTVGPVTATRISACAVSVSAPFTDPGTGDTHTAAISWGDSATTVADPATAAVAGTHTYGANGTYTIGVSVMDDDGGNDAATASFATQNTPSAIMQPINSTGTKSVFKLGSTIPVKITVTGCDGAAVSTLTPTVALSKLDATPDGTLNETALETVATNGLQMRWSDTQYIYNLSTKLSQHTGAALTAGSYKVTVSDSSFTSAVSAQFDLRK